jgi:hypothetical protein
MKSRRRTGPRGEKRACTRYSCRTKLLAVRLVRRKIAPSESIRSRSRGAHASELSAVHRPKSRAQGRRAPAGAHGPRATKKHAAEPQAQPSMPGLPCAMVLTAASYSPRGPAFLPPYRDNAKRIARGISTGMPGPYDLTVRIGLFVGMMRSRCNTDTPTASPPRVS